MKTAVIYARYSSDSQTEQSIESQVRVCKEYAERNDIIIVDTYIDRAMTGTNDNRAAFQKMLKDSSNHQFSTVLVYKLDRFSRNKYESVIHKKTLKDNGVKVISAMENIPDTPEGTLMEALLEGFNQYYSEELTQKVNRGLKESWLKGNATGGGHVFGYDIVNKKYVINEYEKEIVLKVYEMYSNGYRAKCIADELNNQGFHRIDGKGFNEKYILHILHNGRYTGKVTHQEVTYDKIYPQIVDDVLWNKVDAINQDNKIAPSRKKEIYDYILSGKLTCGECYHKMFGESGTSKTGEIHYYYTCSTRRKHRGHCTLKSIRKEYLEDIVIHSITNLLSTEKNIDFLSTKVYEYHQANKQENMKLKVLEQHRKDVVKAMQNIVKAIEQGIITDMTKTRLQELEAELTTLDIEIQKEKCKNYINVTKENIDKFLRKQVFENTDDIKIRKLIVNTFVREVRLYHDKVIILLNFITPIDNPKFTVQENIETEKQINSALSNPQSSYIQTQSPPSQDEGLVFLLKLL